MISGGQGPKKKTIVEISGPNGFEHKTLTIRIEEREGRVR